MICTGENDGRDAIIESLLDPTSYVHSVDEPVVLYETHISWVLLAGDFAYKIKHCNGFSGLRIPLETPPCMLRRT
jgi:hypothetical protein